MRRLLLFAAVLLLASMMTSANASWYFSQDDFYLNMPGWEGSAGQNAFSDGTLNKWTAPEIVAWYQLTGTNTVGAVPVGGQWYTVYDTATLKLWGSYNPILGYSNLLWEGTGFWNTYVNIDQSLFDATAYNRPAYETEPTTFQSVGNGWFDYTAGSWTGWESMEVKWLGTYNWRYLEGSFMIGNAQAEINPIALIPEPGSLLALGAGLAGLAGMIRRRRR